jgi:N-methylhydantoinase B
MTDTTASLATPLRELTDSGFTERYGTDRFTAAVLGNRMRYVLEHMSAVVLTNAFSQVLRDWYDFNGTVSGPPELDYPMPAVGNSLAAFFGTMADAVRNTVEEYGADQLRPGDVLIANDPYRVGNHVNDMCFIRPVFADGRVVSFVTMRAHQLDIGGITPGGFGATKANVFETGLAVPPLLLYRDDEPVTSTFNLVLENSRFGGIILPDIKTIYASLLLGERLLLESIERYGVDAYLGAVRYAVDSSAESMSAAIASLPDGTYSAEEFLDADGVDDSLEYRVRVTVTKAEDRLEIDFGGSSVQARTCINASVLDTKAGVVMALKFLLDPTSSYSSGAFRNVDVVLPPGTFLSATPPDGAIFFYWEATQTVMSALFRALEPALGERAVGGDYGSLGIHNANGVRGGVPWVSIAQCGAEHGPWGATRHGDADSYQVFYQANSLDPATEAIESDVPAVVLRKEYVTDSAGPGTHRGGASLRRDTLYLDDAQHWTTPLSTKRAAGIGVNGGQDGGRSGVWLFGPESGTLTTGSLLPLDDDVYAASTPVAGVLDPVRKTLDADGEYAYFASNPVWHTAPGATFRYQTNGGGGWGDPLERDPDKVRVDVRDEYVSVEGAYRQYGVVVVGDPANDPEGLTVDADATDRRRAELRAAR